MHVLHPTFGPGVIEGIEGRGADARLHVRFSNGGIKVLVARFAPLNIVEA
jgi:DNA helicase-2/ATP-dependent DNA helicase PcrA